LCENPLETFKKGVRKEAGNIFKHEGVAYQLDFILDCDEERRHLTSTVLDNAEKIMRDKGVSVRVFQIEELPSAKPRDSFNSRVKVLSVLEIGDFRERCGGEPSEESLDT
jgi:hypothetical protein